MEYLIQEEEERLIDMDTVARTAIERVETSGMIFLDEIDKIAGRESGHGPDVSREGVQRDILPIVEGTTVNTRYGMVRTDHILFIAAGAFHVSKPSDLIPELQGRFPIRVELESLTIEDFKRILVEPKNSLVPPGLHGHVQGQAAVRGSVRQRQSPVGDLARERPRAHDILAPSDHRQTQALVKARPLQILCLGAHPDDIEIGCGGTVLSLLANGRKVSCHWVVFSGGGTPREQEARTSAARFLKRAKRQHVDVHAFRDGFLPYIGGQVKDAFEALAKGVSPDAIFTHARHDRHQ